MKSPIRTAGRLQKRIAGLPEEWRGLFDAEAPHLLWLADRVVEAERDVRAGVEGASGRLRDFTREFGLASRSLADRLGKWELEARRREAAAVSPERPVDWKLRVIEGGDESHGG